MLNRNPAKGGVRCIAQGVSRFLFYKEDLGSLGSAWAQGSSGYRGFRVLQSRVRPGRGARSRKIVIAIIVLIVIAGICGKPKFCRVPWLDLKSGTGDHSAAISEGPG